MSDLNTVDTNNSADNPKDNKSCTCCHKSFELIMIFLCALGLLIPFILQSWNHRTNDIKIHIAKMDTIPQEYVLNAAEAARLFHEIEKKS